MTLAPSMKKHGAWHRRGGVQAEEDREEGEMFSDDIMLRERYRKTVIQLGLKCRPGLPTGRPTVAIGNHGEQMELDAKKRLW